MSLKHIKYMGALGHPVPGASAPHSTFQEKQTSKAPHPPGMGVGAEQGGRIGKGSGPARPSPCQQRLPKGPDPKDRKQHPEARAGVL